MNDAIKIIVNGIPNRMRPEYNLYKQIREHFAEYKIKSTKYSIEIQMGNDEVPLVTYMRGEDHPKPITVNVQCKRQDDAEAIAELCESYCRGTGRSIIRMGKSVTVQYNAPYYPFILPVFNPRLEK